MENNIPVNGEEAAKTPSKKKVSDSTSASAKKKAPKKAVKKSATKRAAKPSAKKPLAPLKEEASVTKVTKVDRQVKASKPTEAPVASEKGSSSKESQGDAQTSQSPSQQEKRPPNRNRNRNRKNQSTRVSTPPSSLPIDMKIVSKRAWKIFLGEVNEDGVSLIDDKVARELSKRCFRLAEIFTENESFKNQKIQKKEPEQKPKEPSDPIVTDKPAASESSAQ